MLELQGVGFNDHHHQLLRSMTTSASEDELTFFTAETPLGRTALALIASGRMLPDKGRVLLDGESQPKRLRRSAALVDSPGITAPEHHMRVRDVVVEALGLRPRTGTPSFGKHRVSADAWLQEIGAADLAEDHLDTVSPEVRTWLLTELAFTDPQVRLAVLDSPDRHGLPGTELGLLLRDLASAGNRSLIAVVPAPALRSEVPARSDQETSS